MDFFPFLFYLLVIVPSAIFHEYMHGWVADQLGDPTARYAGRLTLNPKAHIDPIGSILLPLGLFLMTNGGFSFAYAKPVPYNPYNLRYGKYGPILVAIAGPLANLSIAIAFSLVLRFWFLPGVAQFLAMIVYANILLAVFNLVPIPPLDGSKILYAVLPHRYAHVQAWLDRYGFVVLLVFVFFFFGLLHPLVGWIFSVLTGFRAPL